MQRKTISMILMIMVFTRDFSFSRVNWIEGVPNTVVLKNHETLCLEGKNIK